jgi:hypothetical protein
LLLQENIIKCPVSLRMSVRNVKEMRMSDAVSNGWEEGSRERAAHA